MRYWNESANTLEALETLQTASESGASHDLAFLDMHMPEVDGLELARAIKADRELARVRLIMMTSAGWDTASGELEQAGVLQYLSKPVRQSQLHDCLVNIVGNNRIAKQCTIDTSSYRWVDCEPCAPLPAHVLLAEDNAVNQEVACSMLEALGCRVSVVDDGRAAVEAMSENEADYDAVLMDCQMPGMDGFEATAEVRKLEAKHTSRTPIIALTANALDGDRERCLAVGMDDYLSKPFNQLRLREVLARWIEQPYEYESPEKCEA